MKTKLGLLLLGLVALADYAQADQYLYPYGWSGNNGSTGQCLTSNGPSVQPSFQACGGGGGGSGTVTSVGLTVPSWLTVTGSPVTTSGTLAVAGTTGQTANSFLATPNGSTGAVSLRTIVAADLPALGATPTGSIGLSAVAGSATTYVRSDGSLPLDLTISPTWTGTHTFSATEPRLKMNQSGAGTDLKLWDWDIASGVSCFRTRTDADGAGQNVFCATRGTTTALTNITFGYSVGGTYTFPFTGAATFSGPVSVDRLSVTGTSSVSNGLSLPTANTLTAYSNSAARAQFTSVGVTALTGGGFVSGGTKFTAAGTGCTVGTTTGGGTAGTFTLAAGPCTSVVITMGGATGATAPNGWSCQAHDRTAPTVLIGGESVSSTTTATFTIPAGAGTTDVISFSCTGF